MQRLQITKGREHGNLWTRKPCPDKQGCIVEITNTPSQYKSSKFVRCAFSPCGERMVAADQIGQLFIFDLHKNRYTLLLKGTKFCTAIDFPALNLVVAAFSDNSVKVIDSGTQEIVGDLSTPSKTVTSLSHHECGRYILTCSIDSGALWDLQTFDRKRMLAGANTVGLKELLFIPESNIILTCFRDDSIFGWDCETLEHLYCLHKQAGEQPAFNCFTTTCNGDFLIAGGRSRYLHVWRLHDQKLHHIVELPEKVKSVKQLISVPQIFDQNNNTVFGALSQDGIARFISLNTYKIVFTVGCADNLASRIAVSPNGKHLSVVLDNGGLQVISMKALTKKTNPAPVPLVKAITVPARDIKLTMGDDTSRKRRCFKDVPIDLSEISTVDMKKLKKILRGFGEYPEKYRHFIWRLLLKIPENTESYGVLLDKGIHPAFEGLQQVCPIKSAKLQRVLQRVLSCLGHWSSLFSITDYLPMLAFPFVKMFQNNHLVAFEVIATFILNWCQHWYEYFPHPPVNILTCVENLLNHHDTRLLQHLTACSVSAKTFAWPLLYTVFSEVLSAKEWMVLMDHVVSNHPGFLLCLTVVYVGCSRQVLLDCTRQQDFEYYFHNRNSVCIKRLISNAYQLWETCPKDIHPRGLMSTFTPLIAGDYPIFNNYPEKVVNYQLKERERIHKEELEYVKQRQLTEELKGHTSRLQQQEEGWRREQEMLGEAERQRRQILLEEESKLTEQRIRLQAMKRELRLREVQVLDTARKNFIENAERDHRDRLKVLEEDIKRKAVLREFETKTAVEEVALKELEIETQRGLLEQELAREMYVSQKIQADRLMSQQNKDDLLRRQHEIDMSYSEDRATVRVQDAQHELARSAVKSLSLKHSKDTERAQHINAIYTEMMLNDVRQKEAENKTDKEMLETVLKSATKDFHTELLHQRDAINQQRVDTLATENRVEQLYEEIKNMKGATTDTAHEENQTPKQLLNKRRDTLDRKQADAMKHARDLRNKLTAEARSNVGSEHTSLASTHSFQNTI